MHFKNYTDNVWFYPAKDLLFYSADLHGSVITGQRLNVLSKIFENDGGVIVTTIDGCMEHMVPVSAFKESIITLLDGEEYDSEALKKNLVNLAGTQT